MERKFTYEDVLFRLGYFRNRNNLSAREVSIQLDHSGSFINRIENKHTKLNMQTLLEFFELVNITPIEFFYFKPEQFKKDKEIFDLISNLTNENRELVINLIKKLSK